MDINRDKFCKCANFKEFKWGDVTNWVMHGGSFLGTQKQLPNEKSLPRIAEQLKKHNIQALLMVGGFEVAFFT